MAPAAAPLGRSGARPERRLGRRSMAAMARPKRRRRPSMLAESWRCGRATVRGDGGASSGTEAETRGDPAALRHGPASASPGCATGVGPAAWVVPPAPFGNGTKTKKPGSSTGAGGGGGVRVGAVSAGPGMPSPAWAEPATVGAWSQRAAARWPCPGARRPRRGPRPAACHVEGRPTRRRLCSASHGPRNGDGGRPHG